MTSKCFAVLKSSKNTELGHRSGLRDVCRATRQQEEEAWK
jgi:hypothetical protein